MPKVMNVPDGNYGTPDPDQPDVMTLWLIRRGNMSAWPKGVRYAPFPPRTPAHLKGRARAEWRSDWYADVYWEWKDRVVAAIAADLELARSRFAQHVPKHERPAIVAPVSKAEAARRRVEETKAALLYERPGVSLEDVMAELGLPQTTTWRRIEAGRLRLAQVREPAPSPRTSSRGTPLPRPEPKRWAVSPNPSRRTRKRPISCGNMARLVAGPALNQDRP